MKILWIIIAALALIIGGLFGYLQWQSQSPVQETTGQIEEGESDEEIVDEDVSEGGQQTEEEALVVEEAEVLAQVSRALQLEQQLTEVITAFNTENYEAAYQYTYKLTPEQKQVKITELVEGSEKPTFGESFVAFLNPEQTQAIGFTLVSLSNSSSEEGINLGEALMSAIVGDGMLFPLMLVELDGQWNIFSMNEQEEYKPFFDVETDIQNAEQRFAFFDNGPFGNPVEDNFDILLSVFKNQGPSIEEVEEFITQLVPSEGEQQLGQ